MEKQCVSDILTDQLKTRRIVTNTSLSAEELFDPAKVSIWIKKLLDSDKLSSLDRRIDAVPPQRLTHAAAAYLLGLAVREGLGLNFDFLPRIFPRGAVGDSFYFFWAAICLCHDIGYQYERGSYDRSRMDSPEGRRELLEIRHDLFSLDASSLAGLGISPGCEEAAWTLASLELSKNYDRMRRKCADLDQNNAVIDHGIAGALILYDVLMNEFERFHPMPSAARRRDPSKPFFVQEGELPAHAGYKRFAACAIIIACTVARHNMWIAKPADESYYRSYGLDALCVGGSAAQIRGDTSLEQLLFLLSYMDTIDPVKGLYVRLAESGSPAPQLLDRYRATLLNSIFIGLQEPPQFRWASALRYRSFTISLSSGVSEDVQEAFARYVRGISGMEGWLVTRPPVPMYDEKEQITGVTCYYPAFPKQERIWPGGIREHEVAALCLYAGSGVGKAGFFYQCRNAYQTFNLLMMDGFSGEEVRVLQEKQRPYGQYILEWRKTLEVLTDILNAQCKFMRHNLETSSISYVLSRVDRQVNFDMLCHRKETFTSTSTAGFLPEIARPKKGLVLLNISLTQPVPLLDYAKLLRQAYVYSDEQEVLLPPFLKVLRISEEPLSQRERTRFGNPEKAALQKYTVELGAFAPGELDVNEVEIIRQLDADKRIAAVTLDKLRNGEPLHEDEKNVYLSWKKQFQLLVRSCFGNVEKILR